MRRLLEEIDLPGGCYIDRQAGMLYVWPPSDPAGATVVDVDGAPHLRLPGLRFDDRIGLYEHKLRATWPVERRK